MKYRHEIAEEAVEALTPRATEIEIASTLAEYFLATMIPPFKLSINHNARATRCPIRIDQPGVKKSSVLISTTPDARVWLIEALTHHYEVTGRTRNGVETRSVAITKSHIEHEQRMAEYRVNRAANPELDDDIPF